MASHTCGDVPCRHTYNQAISVLRDVEQRTGSTAAKWAADYLANNPERLVPLPDDRAARESEMTRRAAEVGQDIRFRAVALEYAVRLMAGTQLADPTSTVRDLEEVVVGMAERFADWIATEDYDRIGSDQTLLGDVRVAQGADRA